MCHAIMDPERFSRLLSLNESKAEPTPGVPRGNGRMQVNEPGNHYHIAQFGAATSTLKLWYFDMWAVSTPLF